MFAPRITRFPASFASLALVCILGFGGCVFDKSGLPYSGDAAVLPDGVAPPVCGNGTLDQGEDCDLDELGGFTCLDFSFEGGELTCTTGCVFNTVGCTRCGNGQQEGAEHCDQNDLAGQSCESLSFDGGDLSCAANCQFDTTLCTGSGCGDGVIDTSSGEQCDGAQLNGEFCASLGLGFTGGTLVCGATCQFDTNGCDTCGDGIQTNAEDCDGTDLDGVTCSTLLYDGGNLSCTTGCAFDVSDCSTCGNAVIELGETCDGTELGGASCADLGFTTGTLACGPTCAWDMTGCTQCGNGTVETGEACDDGPGNSNTTPDACREDCTLPFCGDGVCDSADVGGICAGDCHITAFADNFDGPWANGWTTWDDNGWDGTDTWEPATNGYHSGPNSLWCAGNGNNSSTYDNNMDSWAIHSVDLTAAAGYTVYYDLWLDVHTVDGNDYVGFGYSTDGGTNWTVLDAYSGDIGWTFHSYDISPAAGLSGVLIGIFFHADGIASWEHGAYVDDVEVWYQM